MRKYIPKTHLIEAKIGVAEEGALFDYAQQLKEQGQDLETHSIRVYDFSRGFEYAIAWMLRITETSLIELAQNGDY